MSRSIALALAAAAIAGAALTARASLDDAAQGASTVAPQPRDPQAAQLLRSGGVRYRSYVAAEVASLRDVRAAGHREAAAVHRARLAPALAAGRGRPSTDPLAVAPAAARLLSVEARSAGARPLLAVESHVAGAGAAFDGLRDALWARDQGFVGSVDERLATVRAELDRHRRGERFADARTLPRAERRRLAAALDALAWRLDLAARELARAVAPRG